jgi:hypothetical protein
VGRAATGTFDFSGAMIPASDTKDLSWRISDHYPLWVEFGLVS